MGGAERRSRGWSGTTSSASDVGLVVAAATAPGTFARSLSPRSAIDQGLVTGLGTGLQFLLTAGAQDALTVVGRFLTGGGGSPAVRRGGNIAVDCAAVPLGVAVLRALPPRPEDPVRGVVRQAAWRLGATGLAGALLGGAEGGAQALDDRLGLGGRLVSVPLALPVGLAVAYVLERIRGGEGAGQGGDGPGAPALEALAGAPRGVGGLRGGGSVAAAPTGPPRRGGAGP